MIRTDAAILLGAAFTIAVCVALGSLWVRWARLPLTRQESWLFSFLCGSASLSGIVFLLCCAHAVHRVVLIAIGVLALCAAATISRRGPGVREPVRVMPALSNSWRIVFASILTVFGVYYFFNAMAPEISPDGTLYHLWLPQAYLRSHGFVRFDSLFANMPQGLELLFLFALATGRNSSAALVHFTFLMTLPLLIVNYGRRAGIPIASAAAALFVFLSPVVAIDGTTSYNDVAAATLTFAVFHLMQIWVAERQAGVLITAGALAGFTFSIKYTAGFAILYVLGLAMWTLWRERRPWLRPALTVCACAAIFIVPWTVKSWIWAGNPVSPFANRWFPNRYVHITFEDDLRRNLRRYELRSPSEFPLEVLIHGGSLGGILGPLFFAAPLALLALRRPQGRQVLLAAVVFLLPYSGNIGTRFLLQSLPFISLGMAMALATLTAALPVLLLGVVLADAMACWPAVVRYYCPEGIWRISEFPLRGALRLEPEEAWLARQFPPYIVAGMIDQFVPPGQTVFAMSSVARAYTHRDVAVSYESAPGEVSRDIIWAALLDDRNPTRTSAFRFPPRTLRRIRLVQTAAAKNSLWSVSELRLYLGGRALPRRPAWRLTAQPNPWDVPLAFDNFATTRWRSWQNATPGMYVEIYFGAPTLVDSALVYSPPDEFETRCRLDGMEQEGGAWTMLAASPSPAVTTMRLDLRAEATAALKHRGSDYLLIDNNDFKAIDYLRNASLWNIQLQAERAGSRLYRLLP